MSASPVAAVILAAGFSRRLGRPKQTVVIGGETLVERAVRVARQAGLSPVIVVANEEAGFDASLQEHGCIVLGNREAAEGIASSIRCGIEAARARETGGVVLMTCDQVALRPEHLRSLCEHPERVTGSRYSGKTGVPAYFPAATFHELLQLQGDVGARALLRDAYAIAAEELNLDVDTEEDLERARASLEREACRSDGFRGLYTVVTIASSLKALFFGRNGNLVRLLKRRRRA